MKSLPMLAAILGLTLLTTPPCVVASEDTEGAWIIFSSTDAFGADDDSSRWHYWFDAQARYFDLGSGTNQQLLRPGIGYALRDDIKAWVGYARFRTRNASGDVSTEDRLWQQVDYRRRGWLNGELTLRARLLQRSVSTGDDVGHVLRLMAKYARPIGSASNAKRLVLSVEPFINLNDTDWGGEARVSQHRTFIGVGWRLTDRAAIETGYMNQYFWIDAAPDRSNHLAIANFRVTF